MTLIADNPTGAEENSPVKAETFNGWFARFTSSVSRAAALPLTFVSAVAAIAIWALTGKLFDFSEQWQLVVNTGTTIITFLMVFVIQNAQYRDTAALHLKLDELIRVNKDAQNVLLDLEGLSPEELDVKRKEFKRMACSARGEPSPE